MTDTNVDSLLPATEAWLRAVPGLAYPQALASQYPRIANALAAARNDNDALHAQFDALLHDQRGGRRGFPLDVLMDLLALREALIHDDAPPEDDDATRWVS